MQNQLIDKARARRRVALEHMTSRYRDTSKIRALRRMASMSPSELGKELASRRVQQVENIFIV